MRKILMKGFRHNRSVREMEKAGKVDLNSLKIDLLEEVMDYLGLPQSYEARVRFRGQWESVNRSSWTMVDKYLDWLEGEARSMTAPFN